MPVRLSLFALIAMMPLSASAATLSVPFSPQAPEGIWTQPWQDACEETSIVMIDNYYRGNTSLSVNQAKNQIRQTYKIKTNTFGYSLDENADTMVELINGYFTWEARTVLRPSIDQMKQELDAGRPIILPTYGVLLQNPHYRSALLDYHVIVLTGYDEESSEFIANDPGTRHGIDFRYSYDTIASAMHDYEAGNMPRSRKVAIFTSPTISETSGSLDQDNDGLTKREELLYGTVLWLSDSDGDGFADGREVRMGYSPISPIKTRYRYPLVKSSASPHVYRIQNGTKHHILSERAFKRLGYSWSEIRVLSTSLLDSFPEGTVFQ